VRPGSSEELAFWSARRVRWADEGFRSTRLPIVRRSGCHRRVWR
jgi:hypothetical protein